MLFLRLPEAQEKRFWPSISPTVGVRRYWELEKSCGVMEQLVAAQTFPCLVILELFHVVPSHLPAGAFSQHGSLWAVGWFTWQVDVP